MHATQANLQTNQIQKHFVWKAVFVLQTVVFQASTPQSSASVRIKAHNASAQNTASLLLQLDAMPYSAKQSHGKFETGFDEDNSVAIHVLMKQIHRTAVKCIFNLSALLSNSTIYHLLEFTLTSPQTEL